VDIRFRVQRVKNYSVRNLGITVTEERLNRCVKYKKAKKRLTQFQFMKIAVWQLLNVIFRVVNCWLPKNAPYLPPLKVRSVINPPDPLSIKMPWRLWSENVLGKSYAHLPVADSQSLHRFSC
jgi:hypothetical protein